MSALSFFAGHLGVAYVVQKIGTMLGQENLVRQVEPMLVRVFEAASEPHDLDVIRGNAGAIPALLSLSRTAGLERCHDLAVELGDELCRAARYPTFSLRVRDATSREGIERALLTGLSHGAAGFGLALFELYAASGRSDFLDAARSAFDYEDLLFDPDQGNWPDLRPDVPPPGFTCTWCYGAPGIALSRLRAVALDPDHAERHLATGRVALATTLEAIEKNLLEPRRDASLCHGLSGLGEVVLIASQLLDDASYHERAQALGRALIDRYSASADWPSGVPSGGPNPSFMVGLAGIGYWFLRLHEPRRVPPLLLLVSEINEPCST
jgi:lantibiotic modifying enzyme